MSQAYGPKRSIEIFWIITIQMYLEYVKRSYIQLSNDKLIFNSIGVFMYPEIP